MHGSSNHDSAHKVLLVEDNPENQNLARVILQKAGYDVDIVADGLAAVKAFEACAYSLVLMDIQMPVMDGFEATERIREIERSHKTNRVSIIALTAHALKGYREKCLEHDMDDYLTKPLNKKTLLQTIRKWTSKSNHLSN